MHYIVDCTIRTRAQSVRRQHGERISEKIEMMTYDDATQMLKIETRNEFGFKLNFDSLDYKKAQILINIQTN